MRQVAWYVTGGCLALLFLLLVGINAEAGPPVGKNLWRIEGKIEELDLKKKQLLVLNEYGQGRLFAIGKTTEVYIEGKKATLSGLNKGDPVAVLFHKEVKKGVIWRVTERIIKQAVIRKTCSSELGVTPRVLSGVKGHPGVPPQTSYSVRRKNDERGHQAALRGSSEAGVARKPRLALRRPLRAPLAPALPPYTYIWTGKSSNSWEVPGNWKSTNGGTGYPGWDETNKKATTDDAAVFDGDTSSKEATMGKPHTLSTLTLTRYRGTLTLSAGLRLDNGGSMNTPLGALNNPGNAPLTLAGGTFTWTEGNINYSGPRPLALGTISIQSGATFAINYRGTGILYLGDNITNNGLLRLTNTGEVDLANSPRITNWTAIDVLTNNPNGLDRANSTDPYKTIANNGTFRKSTATGIYVIDEPVSDQSSASLIQVQAGTLAFAGRDLSTNQNIAQGSGSIQIAPGATLAGKSITISGGTVSTLGSSSVKDPATIQAKHLTINNATKVYVGDGTNSAVLFLKDTHLDWTGGTFNFYYNLTTGTGSALLFDSRGRATIGATGTTVGVRFFGFGKMPATWNVMDDSKGKGIRNVAQNNPTGWTAGVGIGKYYTLTKSKALPRARPGRQ